MPNLMVKRMEELSTINEQLDKDLALEVCDSITIEDANDTIKGADTKGVELETPGVEVSLGTPWLEIGIRTPGVEIQNINEEDAEIENEEDEGDAETYIKEEIPARATLETAGVTA